MENEQATTLFNTIVSALVSAVIADPAFVGAVRLAVETPEVDYNSDEFEAAVIKVIDNYDFDDKVDEDKIKDVVRDMSFRIEIDRY